MSELDGHHEVTPGSERSFGVVFAIVFALIGFYPLVNDGQPILWCLGVSSVFLVLGFALPRSLEFPNRLWFKFGMLLGFIITPIIMGIIFFVVLTPFGVVMRLFSRNPGNRKLEPEADSYWEVRDEDNNPMGSMKNQF